jgi:hypothetical protein
MDQRLLHLACALEADSSFKLCTPPRVSVGVTDQRYIQNWLATGPVAVLDRTGDFDDSLLPHGRQGVGRALVFRESDDHLSPWTRAAPVKRFMKDPIQLKVELVFKLNWHS